MWDHYWLSEFLYENVDDFLMLFNHIEYVGTLFFLFGFAWFLST
jgi:hypothetical protein